MAEQKETAERLPIDYDQARKLIGDICRGIVTRVEGFFMVLLTSRDMINETFLATRLDEFTHDLAFARVMIQSFEAALPQEKNEEDRNKTTRAIEMARKIEKLVESACQACQPPQPAAAVAA